MILNGKKKNNKKIIKTAHYHHYQTLFILILWSKHRIKINCILKQQTLKIINNKNQKLILR